MTYESIQALCGMAGLLLFVTLFIAVLAFAFWPGNKKSFDEASLIPLQKDDMNLGGSNGR
jgi:cytochrome c oxidase cbb3-type subunit 4